MIDSLTWMSAKLGIELWLLILILVWSGVWKILALWKSARNNHLVWFIIFALINTVGILEILYIFVFSKTKKRKTATRKRKIVRRNKRR